MSLSTARRDKLEHVYSHQWLCNIFLFASASSDHWIPLTWWSTYQSKEITLYGEQGAGWCIDHGLLILSS